MTSSNTQQQSRYGSVLAITLLLAVIAGSLGTLIWGFDKGFLLSDGGFTLLRYQDIQPTDTRSWILDHLIVKALVPSSLRTILGLRYLGFVLNLFSSTIFGLAIYKASKSIFRKNNLRLDLLVLMMLAGFVLSYSFLPSELSYLSLGQFFINISAAMILVSIKSKKIPAISAVCISAVCCSLLVLTRFPSGIALSVIGFVYLIIMNRRELAGVFLVTFLVLVVMLWFHFNLDYNWFVHNVRGMLENPDKNHFQVRAIRQVEMIGILFGAFLAAVLVSYSLHVFHKEGVSKARRLVALVVSIFVLTVWLSYSAIQPFFGSYIKSDFLIAPSLLIVTTHFYKKKILSLSILFDIIRKNRETVVTSLLLFCIPYIGSLGSWGSMNLYSKYNSISHLGLVFLLLPYCRLAKRNILAYVYALLLVIAGSWSYVMNPMGSTPLFKQTHEFRGIRYEPEMAMQLKFISQILRDSGFRNEQGIIAPLTPGIVYLMDSFSPGGVVWSDRYLEDYLDILRTTELQQNPLVIIYSPGALAGFTEGFKEATGLDINEDYDLISKASDNIGVVQIYFPKIKG